MEVTALCIRMLMTLMFMQLAAHAQKVDADFWIIPTRLQVFEYESLSFKCTGFNGSTSWNILRKIKSEIAICGFSKWGVSTESSCTIRGAFPDDSGEYWCEAGGGERSNSVNVAVTAGSVILESPVLPLMEGDPATLSCRNKTTSSNHTADFYKDGLLIRTSSTVNMTIHSVSTSDEGLYKCSISGAGESPKSQLTVRALHSTSETHPFSDYLFPILRNIVPIVPMTMLLLLLGALHCGKFRGSRSRCSMCCDCIEA
ncbi:high affinity immunoglobulin gamma Fc receptor I-like [Micropterus salmoides]|uniref:high affinity immunoglobulin gamma Fc receptor I-like n=1 Tax=Micropterus salmoides TaxID=27706 RepID=UPI0018ED8C1A|nr:high affinity immunoglobulin gamma Fc receptor I-like [Micropterus salmoides]